MAAKVIELSKPRDLWARLLDYEMEVGDLCAAIDVLEVALERCKDGEKYWIAFRHVRQLADALQKRLSADQARVWP